MKILQLCTKVPYPPKDGGAYGVYVFSQELRKAGHIVEIIAVNSPKHFTESKLQINTDNIPIHAVAINTRPSFWQALKNLFFSHLPYHVERFINSKFESILFTILKRYKPDIIQIEGIYLCPYIKFIKKHSDAKIVLRAHNVEHILWQDITRHTKNRFFKTYLYLQTKRLKKYEINSMYNVDGVTAVSISDMDIIKQFNAKIKISYIPFGLSGEQILPDIHSKKASLFYIGALDWIPNQEAIVWFLANIWTEVFKIFPNQRFHLAGRNASQALVNKISGYKGVIFHGEIENSDDFFNQHSIMVVPLFSGSGVRVKIIEAMHKGCLVIASEKAIEGLPAIADTHFLLANTAHDFIEKIQMAILNYGDNIEIMKNAHKLVSANNNISAITSNLVNFYSELGND